MANKLFPLADINGLNGFLIEGTLSGLGYAGYSVSGAGDINGDGIDDVIVGTALTDTSYVVFGQAGGPPAKVELANLDGTDGFIIQGPSGSYAGTSVSSAGDINGDGIDDLIIGARELENNDGTDAGGSYVILGRRNSFGASLDLTTLDGTNGFVFRGTDRWDWTGFAVSGAGDINGDGFDDVIFSAPGIDISTTLGKTYVLFGKAGGFDATLSPSDLNGVNGFVLNGIGLRDYTGWSVSSAGDVNGDGFDDLLIGARWADPASAPSSGSAGGNGQVYVVFGKSDNFASNFDLATLDGTNGFAIDGFFDISANAYGSLGRAVSNAGDMNGDSFDDIIVTANGGVSYVIFGRDGGFSPNLLLSSLDGTNGFKVFASESVNSVSFASVSSAGDLNADGFDDLIFGLPEDQLSDREAGAAYVLFGKATGFGAVVNLSEIDGTGVFAITGIGEYQFAGFSVSEAGDVNADGIDDVIIGAPNSIFGGSPNFQEESYVVYGNAAPELDLNGSEAGIDFVTSIDLIATSNGLTPIISSPIVASDFTISDRNSSTLAGAIITLTNPLDSFEEGFTVNTSGTNITATQTAGILTLNGIDTLANYEKVLKSITYLNTALTITPGDRLVEVIVDDGGAHSNTSALATTTIRYNTNPGNVYTVDTLVDENDGDYSAGDLSLREAIQLVNAGGTIFFDSSLATADVGFGQGTIGLTSDLTIAKSVNIKGLGADRLKVAEGTASFLQINDGVATNSHVLIDGLTLLGVGVLNQETFTLTNSAIVGEGLENYGNATVENTTITLSSNGGIRNYSYTFGRGIVTVANSFITDNRSDGNGGGISNLNGSVTVIDSVIANNISTNTSSLISGSAGGGGIANLEGFVSVSGSTISGNSSAADGGGLLNFAGTISIGDSIFEGNSTSSDGGGIFSRGVGATVTNTQLIGNSASTGGGLYVRGGLTLTDSTIANNTAQFEGGGVYVEFNGDFTAINSAIANNTPDDIFQFNSPPTALDDVYILDEDTTLTVDAPNGVLANDFDQDGDRLSVILLEPVNKGSLTLNPDGSFTYIPDPNANGFDLFTYEVNDGNGGTNIGFVDLFINPVNDAPVAQDDTAATDANTPITLLASALLSNDSDVDSAIDGDILSIIGVSNAINGSVALDADGNVLFTPAAGFSGAASFNYTVSDSNGGTDVGTVTVQVNPTAVNQAPIAGDDPVAPTVIDTDEDTILAIAPALLLANDSDPDGDALNIIEVRGSVGDRVILNATGQILYNPGDAFQSLQVGETATDTFTYTISDGKDGVDSATVTVTITGVNDIPIAVDDSATTTEDLPVVLNVLENDSDIDRNTTLLVSLVAPSPDFQGTVTINSDNTLTYAPGFAFQSLQAGTTATETFTYTVDDGDGGVDVATVTMTITGVNDGPEAINDRFSIDQGTVLTLAATDLLSNDIDVDGDTLFLSGVSNALGGTVTLSSNDTLVFTPDASFSGTASFDYTVSDGNGGSDTTTVDVTVNPIVVNDKLAVTVAGSTQFYDVDSYGGNQDIVSQLTFAPDGSSIEITGNSWKKLALDYTITANTVLRFDFKSTARGEIHGIGFDTDNNISDNRTFKLYGWQNWGIQTFNNYSTRGTWRSYEIPVGNFFTGQMKYLTLVNDHDVANPTANGQFRNIELVEIIPADVPVLTVTVNGVPATSTLEAAYVNQDIAPQVTSTPDGNQVQLKGNAWKRIDLDYTITADTILELEFRSTARGEIHGIGFDNDSRLSGDRLFQFYGTQKWGIDTYRNYSSQAGEWKFYQIRVGDFFTGTMPYLILNNDHDVSNPTAISQFRNIKLYEGTNTQFGDTGNNTLVSGPGNDTLIGVNPNRIRPGSGEVDVLTGQGGADTFILGDVTQVYYDDGIATNPGLQDYALITDFNNSQGDQIQLSGTAAAYELLASPLGNGTAIYHRVGNGSELIGIVEGVSNLTFTSNAFSFV